MTLARPLISSFPLAAPADEHAAVVARRLGQPVPAAGAWGLLTTVLLGVASFGILPLLAWPTRFRTHVAAETQSLLDVAAWAQTRGRRPGAAGSMRAVAQDVLFRPVPWIICLLLGFMVCGIFSLSFAHAPFTWSDLVGVTYHYRFASSVRPQHAQHLHRIWVATLSVGYLLHWMQVRAHLADVRRFVERLNPVIESESLPPLTLPSRRWGLGFMWIVAGVLMALYGVWWGIPMLMAAAIQRRYFRHVAPVLRLELHRRLCDVAAQRRLPAARLPVIAIQRCSNARCMAFLKGGARFCSRCGWAARAGERES